jgi:adenylyltransferase/sulfurtransferase
MDRYSRQILVANIGESGQQKLLRSRVLVVGCGALGTVIANNLVRAGIGCIKIVDRDYVELDNLQRQMLFDEEDVEKRMPKALAAADKLRRINSSIEIEAEVKDVTQRNVEGLVRDMDIVLDATDNLETRLLISDACFKHNVPWIYGAVISSYGMTMNIIPGETACFRCLVPCVPAPGSGLTCDTAGVLNAIPSVIASIQSNEAIKILLGDKRVNRELLVIDLMDDSFEKIAVRKREGCPLCRDGKFEYLEKREVSEPIKLCGREMVQVTPQREMEISLEDLKKKLEKVGDTSYMGYLLKFSVDKYELIIFPDGRAFVKGVSDKETARSLYAKYIGV